MIGDVVAMQALGAGLKIRRGIYIAYSERVQIRDSFTRLRKREPPIELQPVGARGNARVFARHDAISCHSERSRGIQRRNRKVVLRDPSTPLRSARDDRLWLARHMRSGTLAREDRDRTCQKSRLLIFLKEFLKLFRSDLERTSKDTTLSKN